MAGIPDRLELGHTSGGERVVYVLDEKGEVLSRTVGSGSMARSVVRGEEICPGESIYFGRALTEEAARQLDKELRAGGAKRVGGDSPDIGRPTTHGWTRKFGDRYDSIFGHGESNN